MKNDADNKEPLPGTIGAIVRSTEPWPWRRMLDQMMLTPERLAAFIEHMAAEHRREKK